MPYVEHLKDDHGHDDPNAGSGFLGRSKELVSHDLHGSSYDWYGVEWWGSSNDTVVKTSNMTHSLPFPLEFITYDIPWLMFMGYGNDSVTGYDEDDEIYGGHGDDLLRGGDGDDVLYGEEDNDRLWGGGGDDGLIGGDGNDQIGAMPATIGWMAGATTTSSMAVPGTTSSWAERATTPSTGMMASTGWKAATAMTATTCARATMTPSWRPGPVAWTVWTTPATTMP